MNGWVLKRYFFVRQLVLTVCVCLSHCVCFSHTDFLVTCFRSGDPSSLASLFSFSLCECDWHVFSWELVDVLDESEKREAWLGMNGKRTGSTPGPKQASEARDDEDEVREKKKLLPASATTTTLHYLMCIDWNWKDAPTPDWLLLFFAFIQPTARLDSFQASNSILFLFLSHTHRKNMPGIWSGRAHHHHLLPDKTNYCSLVFTSGARVTLVTFLSFLCIL